MPHDDVPPVRRAVWVLMFDQLRFDNVSRQDDAQTIATTAEDSAATFTAFDDLDLQSAFFEQYLLQDVRDSATASDILGGGTIVDRFFAQIDTANLETSQIRLVWTNGERTALQQPMDAFPGSSNRRMTQPPLERSIGRPERGFDEAAFLTDQQLDRSLSADFVWIDAQCMETADRFSAAARILQLIQHLRRLRTTEPSAQPILVVSAMRGFSRAIGEPFTSGLDECLIRVPLWIDHGGNHACRIQSLAGSFDLVPTLSEFLIGEPAVQQPDVSLATSPSDPAPLQTESMSLVGICRDFQTSPDRLLKLTGTTWESLRSQLYLLVRPAAVARTDQQPHGTESANRRLYLKPDDFWNVNDVIISFATIADEMEQVA